VVVDTFLTSAILMNRYPYSSIKMTPARKRARLNI